MEVRISPIETLEQRIAPATLVNPTTVTYIDVDGDAVTVKISKGSFDLATDFEFSPSGKGEQLKALHLNNEFQGANLTITAVAKGGGDGFANVGYIDATLVDGGDSIDLGKVLIDGDLGQIHAGDPETNTPALKSLIVHSFGRFGLLTQGNTGDLKSVIYGEIGTLKVITDIKDAQLYVQGDFMAPQSKFANGRIDTLLIGGSLIGGTLSNSGSISTSGDIGLIKIGGDVIGGTGGGSGEITADFNGAEIGNVTIGGSLIGGKGGSSGHISADTIRNVNIGGSIIGGTGSGSGSLESDGKTENVNVRGSILGGDNDRSGYIDVENAGTIKIGRDVRGAEGSYSGAVQVAGSIGKLAIGGSLVGGSGTYSGRLDVNDDAGTISIGGSIIGGTGDSSGSATLSSGADNFRLGGSLLGGSGEYTGLLYFAKEAGTVTIGGDIVGNISHDTGELSLSGAEKVTVRGSIIGGAANLTGVINSTDPIKVLAIGGSVVGGSVTGSASAFATGSVSVDRVETFTIGGSVIAGVDTSSGTLEDSGSIRVGESIGTLSIRGSIVGNASNPVLITTFSQVQPSATGDVSLGKLTVGGHVEYAKILAGFGQNGGSPNPDAFNGNASIGTVKVGGDWVASSLVAGVKNLGLDNMPAGLPDNLNFGDTHDVSIGNSGDALIARIAGIQIGGKVVGSTASNDHFGFSAQQIGAVKIGGVSYARTAGLDAPVELSLTTGDVTIREVA